MTLREIIESIKGVVHNAVEAVAGEWQALKDGIAASWNGILDTRLDIVLTWIGVLVFGAIAGYLFIKWVDKQSYQTKDEE